MDRRHFLKATGLAFLYSMLWKIHPSLAKAAKENIIVIGAGMSGLACARELVTHGYQVTLLEGRNRLGGRIWTNHELGVPMDLGASWIHGVRGNPITKLAKEFKAKTSPTDYEDVYVYDAGGERLSDGQVEAMWGEFEGLVAEIEAEAESLDRDISIGKAIKEMIRGERLEPLERRFLDWIIASLSVTSAAQLEQLSLFYSEADEAFGGGDRLFPGGFDQIVKNMAAGLDIRYEKIVRSIQLKEGGVEIKTKDETFEADRVVVTLPLGVLKAELVEFRPSLSREKREAIRRLNMGVLNKVVLQYPEIFWQTDREFIGYMSTHPGEFPEFLNLTRHIHKPFLMGFTGGDFAKAIEHFSKKEMIEQAHKVLQKIHGKSIPKPINGVVAKWSSDPFARGSYSHIPVGATPSDYETLARSIKDRVYFAGEATTRRYPGTVHGAFLTGIREAKRIRKGHL